MAAVRCQGISVRTDAPEGTRRIMASEGALIAQFQALVHIFADLVDTWRESIIAGTLKTTVNVAAGAIAADILHAQALVVVYATSSGFIQHVSRRALAAK